MSVDESLVSVWAELGWDGAPSLDQLVGRWRTFVSEAEAGYQLSIYDYTAELGVRDALQSVLRPAVAEPEHGPAVLEVESLDQRFMFATRPNPRGVAPGLTGNEGRWWFRVPIKMGAELQRDLESEGLVG